MAPGPIPGLAGQAGVRRAGAVPADGSLDEQFWAVARRSRAKREAVADLLARRLTPLEAAARFRDLNRQPPDLSGCHRRLFPGETEEEIACRQVLTYVREELGRRSPGTAAEVARLEAAWQENRDRHGAIRLPRR